MTDDTIRHVDRLDYGPALTSTARIPTGVPLPTRRATDLQASRVGEEMKNYRIRGRAASHSSRLRTGKAAVALTAVFAAAALLLPAAIVTTPAAAASLAPPLTRYPYLTDVVGGNATVNFGTDQSKISAVVKWGQAGAESCTAHSTTATKTNISVHGVGEYQWKAQLSPLLAGHGLLLPALLRDRADRSAGQRPGASVRHAASSRLHQAVLVRRSR